MKSLFLLIDSVINIYIWLIIINAILSWLVAFNVLNTQNRFVFAVLNATHQLTDPVLNKDSSGNIDFGNTPFAEDSIARSSAGVVLEWQSGFGPINLVFAYPIDDEDYDDTAAFEFSMGTKF